MFGRQDDGGAIWRGLRSLVGALQGKNRLRYYYERQLNQQAATIQSLRRVDYLANRVLRAKLTEFAKLRALPSRGADAGEIIEIERVTIRVRTLRCAPQDKGPAGCTWQLDVASIDQHWELVDDSALGGPST